MEAKETIREALERMAEPSEPLLIRVERKVGHIVINMSILTGLWTATYLVGIFIHDVFM